MGFPPLLELVRVDRQHRLAICVPYKAGSETWRYLLSSLANTSNQQPLIDLKQLQLYRRAIQVREPYERLLSAYRFTFLGSSGLRNSNNLARVLLDRYPELGAAQDLTGQPTPSFPQFIQSIVTGFRDFPASEHSLLTSGAALHWLPYYTQCNPCHPAYRPHTLIRLESWHRDTAAFLSTAGVNTNRTFFQLNAAPGGHSSDPSLLYQYYSQVGRDVITKLADIYHVDFVLFQFDKEKIFRVLDKTYN